MRRRDQLPLTDRWIAGFEVRVDDGRVRRYLEEIFAALPAGDPGPHRYEICEGTDGSELWLGGERLWLASTPSGLIRPLVHDLNRRVIEGSPHLMLHAGGVERAGRGIVLPGAMEAGKTTVTTALVRAGFDYLTDEAVAVDRRTLQIHPYPKPLSLDPGAWPLFPELEPSADLGSDDYKADQWQVAPQVIRDEVVGTTCPVRHIVFPRYEEHATSDLQSLSRAEALLELTKHTFGFRDQSREALDLLAEVVRGATCHRLTMGDLDRAIELVVAVVDSDGEPGMSS